jgi:RHS repeat-associated protein
MAGISSKALSFGDPGNNKKYNGIEYDSSFGLDEYEAQLRDLDPQTGRWWQIDPMIEDGQFSESPYQAMDNDPVLKSDLKGDEACCSFAAAWDDIKTTEKISGTIEVAGFGPEDPVADGGVILTNVIGLGKAVYDFVTKSDKPVVQVKTEANQDKTTDEKKTDIKTDNTNTVDTKNTTTVKKDRVVDQKPGEKAQNQLDGIEKAQQKAKNNAPIKAKQNKINSTRKSQQNLKTQLKNIKNLSDAKKNF